MAGGGWSGAVEPALDDGEYTLVASQSDEAANELSTPPVRFTVSTEAPVTHLEGATEPGAPEPATSYEYPGFTFRSSKPGRFECRLDGGAWEACTSPMSYGRLANGSHVFEVRAYDDADRVDATPPERRWRIDTTPPEPRVVVPAEGADLTDGNVRASGTAGTATGDIDRVWVDVNDATSGAVRVSNQEATVDADGRWALQLPSLPDGDYELLVTQDDEQSNRGYGHRSFSVGDSDPETVLDLYYAPPALTNSRDATFAFTSTKAGARFECRLDGSAWATCTTMHRLAGVADGLRRFEVRSIVGPRLEPEPAAYEWTVDATAPVVRIEAPADGTQTDDHTPRIGGTAGTAVGDQPEVCVTGVRLERRERGGLRAGDRRPLVPGRRAGAARRGLLPSKPTRSDDATNIRLDAPPARAADRRRGAPPGTRGPAAGAGARPEGPA